MDARGANKGGGVSKLVQVTDNPAVIITYLASTPVVEILGGCARDSVSRARWNMCRLVLALTGTGPLNSQRLRTSSGHTVTPAIDGCCSVFSASQHLPRCADFSNERSFVFSRVASLSIWRRIRAASLTF